MEARWSELPDGTQYLELTKTKLRLVGNPEHDVRNKAESVAVEL